MTGVSFLDLSREVRDQIYHEVLYSPHGIRLHDDRDKTWAEDGTEDERRLEGGWMESFDSFNEKYLRDVRAEIKGGYDDGDDDNDLDDIPGVPYGITTDHQISTSILYVNRQIYVEASQVLYVSNRITFDIGAVYAIRFLKSLPATRRSHIRHLGFGRHSTAADDYNCTKHWKPLCTYIKRHLQISSVTVQIPHDSRKNINRNKRQGKQVYMDFFWWPAAFALRDMLMDKKISELRLAHAQTYLLDDSEEDAEVEVDECDFKALSLLQYPRRDKEMQRERRERQEYRRAEREGRSRAFQSLDALKEDQEDRRERLDFVARREDDTLGDFGTVLVLTRRKK